MKELIKKDFFLLFSNKNRKKHISSIVFTIVLSIAFVALESFIFINILKKIGSYADAAPIFFKLFLSIMFLISICVNFIQINKLFFNEDDASIMNTLPIKNSKRIMSKMLIVCLTTIGTSFILNAPIFLSYFFIYNDNLLYLLLSFLYPFIIFFLSAGLCLIFVAPIRKLFNLIKKNMIIHIIVVILLMIGLAVLYYFVLDSFILLVSGNDFAALVSKEVLSKINKATDCLIIFKWLLSFITEYKVINGILFLGVAMSIFFVGVYIAENWINFRIEREKKNKKIEINPTSTSLRKALIKKEFNILLNSGYLYSFSGLLIITPLLLPLVIHSINTIFNQSVFLYYVTIVPSFVRIVDMLLILIFVLTIASGYHYFEDEKKHTYIIGLIPVRIRDQLMIKLLISQVMIFASLLVTHIILVALGIISWSFAIVTFIETMLMSVIFSLATIKVEFGRSKILLTFTIYIFPIILFALSFVMSIFLVPYWLIAIGVIFLTLAYFAILLVDTIKRSNLEMEDLL